MMRADKNLLIVTHLSQLLDLVTGFGGLIVPVVLWLTQKERVIGMDEHGKAIVNFQISLFLLAPDRNIIIKCNSQGDNGFFFFSIIFGIRH